jgi:mutator protein MutT
MTAPGASKPTIVVTAAVIERDGLFLITRRQPGVHLAGHWEFPGGKCDGGETLAACIARELREELSVDATPGEQLLTTTHEYEDRRVELHFVRCAIGGVPQPLQGQEMRWVKADQLKTLRFPPADEALIRLLTDERSPPARTATE